MCHCTDKQKYGVFINLRKKSIEKFLQRNDVSLASKILPMGGGFFAMSDICLQHDGSPIGVKKKRKREKKKRKKRS